MKNYIVEQYLDGWLVEPLGVFENTTLNYVKNYLVLNIDIHGTFEEINNGWKFNSSKHDYYWIISEYLNEEGELV